MATEKIGDAADKQIQSRTESMTVEERWAERSKRALENASRAPPAHKYSGMTQFIEWPTFETLIAQKRSNRSRQGRGWSGYCV